SAYRHTRVDVTLQPLSYSFDGFVANFYSSLLSGGKLILVPGSESMDFGFMKGMVKQYTVTNISLVPRRDEALLDGAGPGDLDSLRFLVLGGEQASGGLIRRSKAQNPGLRHIVEYGPTEATVTATVNLSVDESNTATVGRPIANVQVYIMDQTHRLQPAGIGGELCIAGIGLARGYLNNPELTAGRFVLTAKPREGTRREKIESPIPHSPTQLLPHSPIYKTGDLARWLPDGNIEFIGRIDHQVKIRGFRIELGEIEARLSNHPEIKETAVVAKEETGGDQRYLAAYITGVREFNVSELREYLDRELPGYMIPSYFVKVEKIPVTANGKIDTGALPDPEEISVRDNVKDTPPKNIVEETLVEVWESVLGRDHIGTNENFFQVGGDSIKSVQIMSRMSSAGYKLEMKDLFRYPVISELA
ncbi:MAG: non-ribosomal peptide synthetase, partial [bacterium]|nr:non-ribosomal peptide synthetase [bacterium]